MKNKTIKNNPPSLGYITAGVLISSSIMFTSVTVAAPGGGGNKKPLDPATQTQFVVPLPNPLDPAFILQPSRIEGGEPFYEVSMKEFKQDLGLKNPKNRKNLLTTVWGYGDDRKNAPSGAHSFPGPTLVTFQDQPVRVLWTNKLPTSHLLPLDTTLHCGPEADPNGGPLIGADGLPVSSNCRPEVRTVAHLHGSHADSDSDGYPEAWFSPGFNEVGPLWKANNQYGPTGTYRYRNDQQAATLWYHDHSMGTTRLNVYAGLAGFNLLRDTNEQALQAAGKLPQFPYEVPLVIQDRSFYDNGSLLYPDAPFTDANGNPVTLDPVTGLPVPSAVPEFFGDFVLVNGVVWPVMNVEPRQYRFRTLNGSGSRFYNLRLTVPGVTPNAPRSTLPNALIQIGSDGGFLDAPVYLSNVTLGPAERADLIIDFSDPALAGQTILVENDANSPFPDGAPVNPATTGRVMAFRVNQPLDAAIPDTTLPVVMNSIVKFDPQAADNTRQVVLFEEMDALGRLQPLLGTASDGPLLWSAPVTENPALNSVEIWEVINFTVDAHPIHIHQVQFQVLNRQRYNTNTYVPGNPASLQLLDGLMFPAAEESGWKDTVKALPGEVTRVIARYDIPGLFVWHCHILEHEDHEMMRPFWVGVPDLAYPPLQ